MAVRVNPVLIEELEHYGAEDVSKCYHCGNCTATCPLSHDQFLFPRRCMRYLQMGLEKRLRSSLEPWLCYYCGECSEQCPREAQPGETMMSMRRWLTGQYDITGISRMFYRSWWAELAAVILLAELTCIGLLSYGYTHGGGNLSVYDGPGAFLPAHFIHELDWVMGGVLFALLIINCFRMWRFTMFDDHSRPIPISAYLHNLLLLPVHFLTQKRLRECENKRPWAFHIMIMGGYTTMLVLIVFFLPELQAGPAVRWEAHIFGYLASIGLVVGLAVALRGRLTKELPYQRYTHQSDWIFLGLLIFIVLTGITQHILHRAGLPMGANVCYIVHLMGVVSFEVTQVPFGKWSHLAYRPLAIYFSKVQAEAHAASGAVPLGALIQLEPAARAHSAGQRAA
jgi:ferredoxin